MPGKNSFLNKEPFGIAYSGNQHIMKAFFAWHADQRHEKEKNHLGYKSLLLRRYTVKDGVVCLHRYQSNSAVLLWNVKKENRNNIS